MIRRLFLSALAVLALAFAAHSVTLWSPNTGDISFPGLTPTTINNMAIGQTTPAPGKFTALTADSFNFGTAPQTFDAPITVNQNVQGIKARLAMKLPGQQNDAPTALGYASTYLGLGGGEWNANSYRMIGFGYILNLTDNYPAQIGYQETSTSSNTRGDLVFATRSVNTNTAPTIALRIDSAGQVKLENAGYVPASGQSVVNKTYVDTNALGSVTASRKFAAGEASITGTGTAATGLATIASCTLTIKVGTAPGLGTSVATYTTTGATLNLFAWKPTDNTNPTLIAATSAATIGWQCVGT